MLGKFQGIKKFLQQTVPGYTWRTSFYGKFRSQQLAHVMIKSILPYDVVLFQNFKTPDLRLPDTGAVMELDVFRPSIRV